MLSSYFTQPTNSNEPKFVSSDSNALMPPSCCPLAASVSCLTLHLIELVGHLPYEEGASLMQNSKLSEVKVETQSLNIYHKV